MPSDESVRECTIHPCENDATREVWNTRAKRWLPACDEHQPMYSDRDQVRPLHTGTDQ